MSSGGLSRLDVRPSLKKMNLLPSSDAGLLGAALLYVLQLGGLFQWSVRQSAEVSRLLVP